MKTKNCKKNRSASQLFNYYYKKAIREKGSPHYIALGWALGVCIGFAIPFGLQLMISIPLSFLLKCSKLGATLGTLVTNHFSIIIIYPFQTWLGNRLLRGHLTLKEMEIILKDVFEKKDYNTLFGLGMEISVSFLLGGVIPAVVFAPAAYYGIRTLVIRYRKNAALRKVMKKKNAEGNSCPQNKRS